MIERLHIKNFRSLKDTTVDLAPLTVLVGPNDSGKTTLLHAIHTLGRLTEVGAQDVFVGDHAFGNMTWRREKTSTIDLEVTGATERGGFGWQLSVSNGPAISADTLVMQKSIAAQRDGFTIALRNTDIRSEGDRTSSALMIARMFNAGGEFDQVIQAITSQSIYHLDPRLLRSRSVPRSGALLSSTGDNLASVLDGLITGPDRDIVVAMERALQDALPTLKGFAVRPPVGGQPGEKSLEFVLSGTKPMVTIPCALASDGAMLLTAFLALAYSDTPGILLIEEPENGLHPRRIGEVMELLRKMTTGKVGNRPRQIILTTHSPLLLNYAKPEEVRIVLRDRDEGTRVTPMSDVKNVDELLKEFGIGELWYLVGEQGLVEGKGP